VLLLTLESKICYLENSTCSLQKQKTPQTPPLVLSLSLWQIVLGGVAIIGFLSSRCMHDTHNPNISIWRSQPKYIHLTDTTQIYSFGHSTEFLIWSWDFMYAQIPPTPQRKRGTPKIKKNVTQLWKTFSLSFYGVCVCVLFKFSICHVAWVGLIFETI